MTREEFIKTLDKKRYSYEIEGDKIVVTHKGDVYLRFLTSLPLGVEFRNKGQADLRSLTSLPLGVEFRNGWDVDLRSLTSLPPGVVFKNGGVVKLNALIGEFNNFNKWQGNIKRIASKRLLNLMISKGVFER